MHYPQILHPDPALHRAEHATMTLSANLSTGFPALDKLLPGGGWPTACVTEILARDGCIDPLSLLLPALASLSWEPRWLAWIAPPHLPVVEELAEQGLDLSRVLVVHRRAGDTPLEIAAKALKVGACAAVLVWAENADAYQIGQLQRAAKRSGTTCFVFRPATALAQPPVAELRIYATTHSRRLAVEILHCQGGPGTTLQLDQCAEQPLFRPGHYRLMPGMEASRLQ